MAIDGWLITKKITYVQLVMKSQFQKWVGWFAAVILCLWGVGCGDSDDGKLHSSKSVDEAADYLSDAFSGSNAKLQGHAKEASEHMKKKRYRKALISIQEIKLSGEVSTMKEGAAVRDSLINLEEELIYAIQSGDKNAQQAYDLLKRVNRN